MGWFVISSSKREQLAGRAQHVLGDAHVSDIMRPAVLAPGWLTVSAFWNEWVNRYPEAAFLLEVWGGDTWKGVVTAQQLAAVPPSMQGSVRAQDVALPLAPPVPEARHHLGRNSRRWPWPAGPGQLCLSSPTAPPWVSSCPDISAMVARGTPVPRRTWAPCRPPPQLPRGTPDLRFRYTEGLSTLTWG